MQIHIINLHYIVEASDVDKIRPCHREFLDKGYAKSIFLASGPKSTNAGGVILAVGDIKKIKEFIKNDPYYLNNIAKYEFSTFNAVKHIPELANL